MDDPVRDLEVNPPPGLVVPRWLAWTWVGGGILGVVAALVSGLVGIAFVGNATDTAVEALGLAEGVLAGVEDTTTVLDTTFTNVSVTLGTVQGSVDDVAATMGQVGTTLDDLTVLVTEDVPDSLGAVSAAMPQLVRTAGVIDSTMRALSFVGVDYDPDAPLDDSLQAVQDQLQDIPPNLRGQREGMEDVAVRLDDLADSSGDVADDLATITADLEASRAQLQGYRATAGQATTLLDDLSARLERQARTARLMIALLAITIAISQTVPVVLGRQALQPRASRVVDPDLA